MAGAQAQRAKDLGNAAFKDGDYPSAIGHYTSAILADQANPTYPLNRAAAYLKLGKHNDAQRDCSTVLDLDKKSVKALFRRAQARIALNNLVDAQKDLKRALELEPASQLVKLELDKVDISLQKQSAKPTRSAVNLTPTDTKPRRRRIPIKIIDPPEPSQRPNLEPQKPISATTVDDLMTPVSSRPFQNPATQYIPPSPAKSATPPPPKSTFQEAKQVRSSKIGGGVFRASGSHTVFKSPSTSPVPTETHIPNQTSQVVPPLAKSTISLFTFTKTWESLTTPDGKWNFLQQNISPQSLPTLFQTSLEPTQLTSLLSTFLSILKSSPEMSGLVKKYMVNLSRVARFSSILLFMSKEEKAVVESIWTILSASSNDDGGKNAKDRRVWGIIS